MTVAEILALLPGEFEVVLRPIGGSVTYTDTVERWVEDDGKLHRLDDFELVTEIHLPGQNGSKTGGTLSQLMGEEIEPLRFVIVGLVPEGLTMLAGKPKLGKSWLALGLSLSVCAGETALGHNTTQAEVLYIALEDGKRRMQDRVRILGGDRLSPEALDRFHYRTEWPTLNQGGIDSLEEWMGEHPDTRLIVVDTYGKVQGELAGKNRYTEEYELLGRLQTFATRHRVAIILVHHLRKQSADDWLEQLSGSQAVTGAADTLLGLFRDRGQMDATLRLVSREVDEKELALKFDGGRWESMGDAAAWRMTVERTEVLEAIEALGGEAKVSAIAGVLSKTVANTSYLLGKMSDQGAVRKVATGVYALPLTQPLETLEPLNSSPVLPLESRGTSPTSRGTTTLSPGTSSTSSDSRGLYDQGNTGRNPLDLPNPF